MNPAIDYVATCLFGLESLLSEEIDDLGYSRIDAIDGRITFRGDLDAAAHANLWLRFAERVYIRLNTPFDAVTFDEVFEGVRALPWEDWIGQNDAFPVTGHSVKSGLTSVPALQGVIKKAIVQRLGERYGITWFSEDGAKYPVEFFLFKDQLTLMIDTSGEPLHKRGYRPHGAVAPIRETLAAALAKLARPRSDVLFWDPFCGSGTIPIEAALLMRNQAPGLGRRFLAQSFPQFPAQLWSDALEEAQSLIDARVVFEAYASDIDPACVALTRQNVERAGMSAHIKCFCKDALTIDTGGRRGTIVCNPPYGERWQIYVITSHERFPALYGRRADKIRKVYNGMIPCYFYQFFKPVK